MIKKQYEDINRYFYNKKITKEYKIKRKMIKKNSKNKK